MIDIKPIDVISLVILIGCFILIALGKDGFVAATITLIVGYYYGHKREITQKPSQ